MNPADFAPLLTAPGQELLARLTGGYDESAVLSQAEKLRAEYPPDLVSAALTQARLRDRAAAKFGSRARDMYFTPAGYEQATRMSVAELRAERYRRAGVRRVADLCCGIGGDALAFAAAGIEVLAVDRDPLTCAVLAANARAFGVEGAIEVRCEGVETVDLRGCDGVFLDPARRTDRGRTFDPEAYSPSWSYAVGLAVRGVAAAVGFKVAPGLPHELIPRGAQAEWVSDRGEVKEAGIYFGALVGAGCGVGGVGGGSGAAERQATLLPGSYRLESAGVPDPSPGPVGRYLYEPDGAVIRAHLLGELAELLGAHSIDPTIAYLTADRSWEGSRGGGGGSGSGGGDGNSFVARYEITDVLPFNVKRLRAVVAERGYGRLTVKKRGADVDPAFLRKQLRPAGPNSAVVVVTRVAGAHMALIAQED
ncbi:MAG TPA: class I SAM-dependent methyltransferase [Actinocrinis sp.]|nr:class I SAM-dependent methyltransferase [Actinocrinis sp.]